MLKLLLKDCIYVPPSLGSVVVALCWAMFTGSASSWIRVRLQPTRLIIISEMTLTETNDSFCWRFYNSLSDTLESEPFKMSACPYGMANQLTEHLWKGFSTLNKGQLSLTLSVTTWHRHPLQGFFPPLSLWHSDFCSHRTASELSPNVQTIISFFLSSVLPPSEQGS